MARRKKEEENGCSNTPGSISRGTKTVTTRTGQRYIIHKYEDNSGLSFGG